MLLNRVEQGRLLVEQASRSSGVKLGDARLRTKLKGSIYLYRKCSTASKEYVQL